jgi:hypothetical protein
VSILDLSDADTSGFQPIRPGTYNANIYEAEVVETSGGGKLPAGVQMVKIRFAVQDEPYEGHPLFTNYPLPNAEEQPDASKRRKSLGSFVNFLIALGYDETQIKKKGFDLENVKDLEGKECVVRVALGKYQGDDTNVVKAVKPAGSPTSGGGADDSPIL